MEKRVMDGKRNQKAKLELKMEMNYGKSKFSISSSFWSFSLKISFFDKKIKISKIDEKVPKIL